MFRLGAFIKSVLSNIFKLVLLKSSLCAIAIFVGIANFADAHAETVYFDGESQMALWQRYSGEQSSQVLTTLFDEQIDSHVAVFAARGPHPGSLLGGVTLDTGWNNRTEFKISWKMKFSASPRLEVVVHTSDGTRFLVYEADAVNSLKSQNSVQQPNAENSAWRSFSRNLARDVKHIEPDNSLLAVNGIIVRGTALLDDIQLSAIDLEDSENNEEKTNTDDLISAPAPISVARRQNADKSTFLTWVPSPSANSYDIQMLSQGETDPKILSGIVSEESCKDDFCVFTLPADWRSEGASLQVRSVNGPALSSWVLAGKPPVANAGLDRSVAQWDFIAVDGSLSSDSDGKIATYHWRNDGFLVGRGQRTEIQLPLGKHNVELTVTDDAGLASIDQVQVTVFEEPDHAVGNSVGDVEMLLEKLVVSQSQLNSHMTSIATANGYVYIANIEHGPDGDADGINLKTVVRQGAQTEEGEWRWTEKVIDERTVFDQWHTAPSIEVDGDGLVHVVYNMHNTPWQYVRTTRPHDLNTFEFYGQEITDEQIRNWKFHNSTSFPSFGYADIPGTQITYPRFEKDTNGELFLTYRFASRPKRSWPDRTFATGIAEYSRLTRSWSAIGKPLEVTAEDFQPHAKAPETSTPFAAKTGWTAYHPSLVFNDQGGMGVFMLWRSGTAGDQSIKPCFTWTDDKKLFRAMSGESLSLPLQPDDCSNLGFPDSQGFHNVADSEMDSHDHVYITLAPTDGPELLITYDEFSGEWIKEESPAGAAEIFLDSEDNLWAVASGPKVFKRLYRSTDWEEVYEDSTVKQCYPKSAVSEDGSTAFIYTQDCDGKNISVRAMRLQP